MKILKRFFYINDYRFYITFLGHVYLWKDGIKSQMNINKLLLCQENFPVDSEEIILYQWLQVLYYFSRLPLPREQTKKSQININKLIIYQESFCEDSHKILLCQWLEILYYFSRTPLPMGTRKKISNEYQEANFISRKFSWRFLEDSSASMIVSSVLLF